MKCVISAAALLLAVLAAAPAFAGYDEATGGIKSVDLEGGKIVVALWVGAPAELKDITFLVNKETTVVVNRERKSLSDLAEGKLVTLVFKEPDKPGDPGTAVLITVWIVTP